MADRKEHLRSGDLHPGDDLLLPITIPPEQEEGDWVFVPFEPPHVEMEPMLRDPVPLEELIPDPDYLEFFNEIQAMLDRGTPDGTPPGIAAFWEEYRDYASAPAPTTLVVSY